MDANDLEALAGQIGHAGRLVPIAFEVLTGEELDLDSAIKHRPIAALCLVAGAAAIVGWLVGRHSQPAAPAPQPLVDVEALQKQIGDLRARLRRTERQEGEEGASSSPLDGLFPQGLDKVRESLPELKAEEAANRAREWIDANIQADKVRQSIEGFNASETSRKVGAFFQQRWQRPSRSTEYRLPDESTTEYRLPDNGAGNQPEESETDD